MAGMKVGLIKNVETAQTNSLEFQGRRSFDYRSKVGWNSISIEVFSLSEQTGTVFRDSLNLPDNLASWKLYSWMVFAISRKIYPKSLQSGIFGIAPSGSLNLIRSIESRFIFAVWTHASKFFW